MALKINEEKTECIIFSKNKEEVHMTLLAGTQVVKSQETVKILRVTLDTKISLDQQYSSISRSRCTCISRKSNRFECIYQILPEKL